MTANSTYVASTVKVGKSLLEDPLFPFNRKALCELKIRVRFFFLYQHRTTLYLKMLTKVKIVVRMCLKYRGGYLELFSYAWPFSYSVKDDC